MLRHGCGVLEVSNCFHLHYFAPLEGRCHCLTFGFICYITYYQFLFLLIKRSISSRCSSARELLLVTR